MGKFEYMKNAFGSDLKLRARLVLQCLVYHSDREGSCFPALKTIASECGYSLSTVKRALRELCEAGYIVKQERFDERKNGGQTSNLYTLSDIPSDEAANVEQPEVAQQDEIPYAEKALKRDQCAHSFTYSFSEGMKCVLAPFAPTDFPSWPGGRVIFIPP